MPRNESSCFASGRNLDAVGLISARKARTVGIFRSLLAVVISEDRSFGTDIVQTVLIAPSIVSDHNPRYSAEAIGDDVRLLLGPAEVLPEVLDQPLDDVPCEPSVRICVRMFAKSFLSSSRSLLL